MDDKSQTHRIYRDLVCGNHNIAYGAERWILTLERMCERFFYFSKLPETVSFDDGFGRGILFSSLIPLQIVIPLDLNRNLHITFEKSKFVFKCFLKKFSCAILLLRKIVIETSRSTIEICFYTPILSEKKYIVKLTPYI